MILSKRFFIYLLLIVFLGLSTRTLYAQTISGDANGDGKVDGVDFVFWLTNYGKSLTGAANGDFNNDGKIDGIDYTLWLTNYGKTISPTNSPTQRPTITNTPTPTGPVPTTPPGGGKHVYSGQSLQNAINSLNSGETLYVHAGTYNGNITATKSNIRIQAWPGDRVVVVGLVRFTLTNSVVDGINVTWPEGASSSEHMVRFSGGSGWTFENAEVWGARSYAGIHVTGESNGGWTIRNVYVHDTYPSNDTNQDHLIYVSSASSGVIERSLFVNSPNGRGIKLGTAGSGAGPKNIVIRYNTFYNNTGPSNIQLSYGAENNQIYRNIFQKSADYNVTAYTGMGPNNKAYENYGWESKGVVESPIAGSNNIFKDPQFTSIVNRDFRPLNPEAKAYGKFAP